MNERQARALFHRTCEKLHEDGWDVVGAISRTLRGATETTSTMLLHGGLATQEAKALHLVRLLNESRLEKVEKPEPEKKEGA